MAERTLPASKIKLNKVKEMKKFAAIVGTLAIALSSALAHAATDSAGLAERLTNAANTLTEIMASPDKSIPQSILAGAACVVVIPKYKKGAFVVGAQYGQGVATCRTDHGWSAPLFVAIEGGSVGYQIGGSSTDLVLLFMNEHALQSLLGDKFKLGAEASVAAGPVGRNATAATDVRLSSEILSYSRTKGIFAGVSLDGAAFAADGSGDRAMYGDGVNRHEIVRGAVPVPSSAAGLVHELRVYSR